MIVHRDNDALFRQDFQNQNAFKTDYDLPLAKSFMKRSWERDHAFQFFNNRSCPTKDIFDENLNSRLSKRQSGVCLASQKVMYMGFAADCTYSRVYGSPANVLRQMLTNLNAASKIYERSFNIALSMVRVVVYTVCSPTPAWNRECDQSYMITDRLGDFSRWRGVDKRGDGLGLWHLMTNCPSGTSVGIAWTGQICNDKYAVKSGPSGEEQRISGTAISTVSNNEWKIVAHEIGHNFGAQHDCDATMCSQSNGGDGQCCPCGGTCDCNAQFLMHPSDNSKTDQFSACSINSICSKINTPAASCLRNPGSMTAVTNNMCGNGVLDEGEECDCGDEVACSKDSCCDFGTCKLKPSARCSDANHECCNQCQIKPSGTVCRPSRGSCDFDEVCSGSSPFCPKDNYKEDGTTCGSGLLCASGFCTSRGQQCLVRSGALNLMGACGTNSAKASCELTCALRDGSCMALSGFFIDGTECGYKSFCQRGTCVAPNFIFAIINWGLLNPGAGYAVLVVTVLIILVGTYFCYKKCCRRWCCKKSSNQTLRDIAEQDDGNGQMAQHFKGGKTAYEEHDGQSQQEEYEQQQHQQEGGALGRLRHLGTSVFGRKKSETARGSDADSNATMVDSQLYTPASSSTGELYQQEAHLSLFYMTPHGLVPATNTPMMTPELRQEILASNGLPVDASGAIVVQEDGTAMFVPQDMMEQQMYMQHMHMMEQQQFMEEQQRIQQQQQLHQEQMYQMHMLQHQQHLQQQQFLMSQSVPTTPAPSSQEALDALSTIAPPAPLYHPPSHNPSTQPVLHTHEPQQQYATQQSRQKEQSSKRPDISVTTSSLAPPTLNFAANNSNSNSRIVPITSPIELISPTALPSPLTIPTLSPLSFMPSSTSSSSATKSTVPKEKPRPTRPLPPVPSTVPTITTTSAPNTPGMMTASSSMESLASTSSLMITAPASPNLSLSPISPTIGFSMMDLVPLGNKSVEQKTSAPGNGGSSSERNKSSGFGMS